MPASSLISRALIQEGGGQGIRAGRLQRVEPVVGSGAAGHEPDRVAARHARAAIAAAQPAHPVAVVVDGEPEAPTPWGPNTRSGPARCGVTASSSNQG